MPQPVFRFAPSPNGALHLGHALSALLNARMAEHAGGRLLLRIEDIDTARCTPDLEAAMLRDLRWLGVRWEEPVRRQSAHFGDYAALLQRLKAMGLIYPGFMSRSVIKARVEAEESRGESWPRDPDGAPLYPPDDRATSAAERGRRIASGAPFAWRLDMTAALAKLPAPPAWTEFTDETMTETTSISLDPVVWGDVVLARREVATSYHLSVVADDALQGVTHVARGRDLHAATAVHRVLQDLLGLPQPCYFHHRLILGPDGRKLSKSFGDTGLAALREAGRSPDDVRRLIALG